MMHRAYAWRPDYADSPDGEVTVELGHVDVGDVRCTVVVTAPDGSRTAVGPYHPDELADLVEVIAVAAEAAARWSRDTSR